MVLQDIFDQLTSGELRKTKLGGSREIGKTISEDDYFIILPAINAAILAVHKRLPIRTESVTIVHYPHITMYKLDKRYARSNTTSTAKYKYIDDSEWMPFNNNVLSIQHVYDMGGHVLPINDKNDLDTVYTPNHNTVQYPYPNDLDPSKVSTQTFDVVYRASIDPVPMNFEGDPEDFELDMPYYAMDPLLAFIQSRLEIGMIRGENVQAEFAALSKFESACILIEKQSLITTETYTDTKVEDHGWI